MIYPYLCVMDKDKSLIRDITLSKLLRTPDQVEFFSTHTLICGIYDNLGLESVTPIKDWENISGLDRLQEKISTLELRTRFNVHRNAETYVRWISNDNLIILNSILNEGRYLDSTDFLLENSKTY